ncbi:MAG TPA: LysR substrate-binding domain-containing protein [Pseudonocardia sp.]|nr:LysR substrate-binding domain-containing protein [Pseudonocardia sp.]
MDVRALRYFVAVAEEGSVHAGARRLLVAQPALSQAIRRLEREVGGAVFHRSHLGVELTVAGAALLEHARFLIDYLDGATEQVREAAARDHGASHRPMLHVGLIEGRLAAAELTGAILSAFRHEHPELPVRVHELSFTGQFDAVLDGTVDVAVVRPPYEHELLDVVPLFSEPSVLAVNAAHPLAAAPEVELEQLLHRPMLEVIRAPRAWRDFWHLAELRNERSYAVPSAAVTLLQLQYDLLDGPALATVAASAWRMALEDPMLRAVPVVDAPRNTVGIGFRRLGARPEVASFVAAARRVTGELIGLVPGGRLIPEPV